MSQQTIELYAVKLAVKKSISLGLHLASLGTVNDCSCFLISDSTSSLHSILKLSTKAKFNVRGKVLRQISASIASCHPHSLSRQSLEDKCNSSGRGPRATKS